MCKTLISGILQTPNLNTITYAQLVYVKIIMESLRERFALQNATEAENLSCGSTTFEIPALKSMNTLNGLKLLGGSITTTNSNNKNINKTNEPPSKLNEFLLAQLQEKRNNGELHAAGFTLPKLQLGSSLSNDAASSSSDCKPFVIPLLQKAANVNSKPERSVTALSKKVQDLHVTESTASKDPIVIDLTTALSTNSIQASPLRRQCKTQSEDFDIPFIECDRVYSKGANFLPTANEYCLADASAELTSHKMAKPSPLGRIICLHYGSSEPLPVIEHSFKVKHVIVPFRFDTMSPDDKVLKSLKKF